MPDERIKLVMSKPLLRLILAKKQVLEKVLTGGSTVLPNNAMPESMCKSEMERDEIDAGRDEATGVKSATPLDRLLATCRDYGGDTGGCAAGELAGSRARLAAAGETAGGNDPSSAAAREHVDAGGWAPCE